LACCGVVVFLKLAVDCNHNLYSVSTERKGDYLCGLGSSVE